MAAAARAYVIEKRGDQWCLLTRDGSRVLGCHDTEAEAQAQDRAIEAAKDHSQSIRGVELFRTGEWNGDKYGAEDLDQIVEASRNLGFSPPIKAGHAEQPGAPAVGWVENLRRTGQSLYGDLVALPDAVYDTIKSRGFDNVSAEIFWNLKRNGKTYPRALKALALLGVEPPAVDLQPLHKFLSMAPEPTATFATYTTNLSLDVLLTREMVEAVCPPCAEAMKAKNITALKIPRQADGTYSFDVLKGYQGGFNEALCEKFGEAEGFRTRCIETMSKHVDDSGAFCNSLKDFCGLMSAKTGGETKIMATKDPEPKPDPTPDPEPAPTRQHEVRHGEVVVTMAQLAELRDRAAKAERLEALEARLAREEAAHAELQETRRAESIKYRLRNVKLPAFRVYVRALYEIAMEAPEVKTYALADDKVKMGAEAVVDALVVELNRRADDLFKVYSDAQQPKRDVTDPDEPEAVQAKIDYRIRAYCKANKLDPSPTKDYKTALNAVLAADPELKAQYLA